MIEFVNRRSEAAVVGCWNHARVLPAGRKQEVGNIHSLTYAASNRLLLAAGLVGIEKNVHRSCDEIIHLRKAMCDVRNKLNGMLLCRYSG